MRLPQIRARLRRDERGAMLVETAILAPVLLLLSMGAFQVSQVIARQSELQGAMAEASAIALTAPPDTPEERVVLKEIIVASSGLEPANVLLSERFRCGADASYVNSASDCVGSKVSTFVLIEITDIYTPIWSEWGVGEPFNFNVNRYVMVKQS